MTMKSRSRGVAWFLGAALCGALVLGGAVPAAAAGASAQSTTEVNAFTGAFQSRVPIGVPGFRGLEPKLAVQYASQGANGPLGVGWQLAGTSVIERASAGRGTPRYDGNDVFVLDGNDLLPSCTTFGGTHCSRIESYQRITWDSGNNRWYVWTKDGTKSTYTSQLVTASGTFRWALAEVRDPRGNAVTYSYTCGGGDCFLDNVSYNGVLVKLYWEGRPDTVSYATGASLATTGYRLKTIDVLVGGSRARAYKLSYTTSGTTARSLLVSVQQFGTNATLDGSGTVTGGTALPAMTFGWQQNVAPPAGQTAADFYAWVNTGVAWNGNYGLTKVGDFNGDGKKDLLCYGCAGGSTYAIAYGTASGLTAWVNTGVAWNGNSSLDRVGDFNGDGKADLMCYGCAGGSSYAIAYGTASGLAAWASTGIAWNGNSSLDRVGDFNGDGKADLMCLGCAGGSTYAIAYGGASGLSSWVNTGVAWNGNYGYGLDRIADFNGDGKADLICLGCAGGSTYALAYGAASGLSGWVNTGIAWNGNYGLDKIGDFNGDGKADLLGYGNVVGSQYAIAYGATSGLSAWANTGVAWNGNYGLDKVADFDGDGRADILGYGNAVGSNYSLAYGTATGLKPWINTGLLWNGNSSLDKVGDFNGDRKADLLGYGNVVGSYYSVAYRTGSDSIISAWNDTAVGWNGNSSLDKVGDFNGDGRLDLLCLGCAGGSTYAIAYGTDTGFTAWVNTGVAWNGNYGLDKIADYNGDGKADLLCLGCAGGSTYAIAYGTASGLAAWQSTGVGWNSNYSLDKVADFDGDGKADLLGYGNVVTSQYAIAYGRSSGLAAWQNTGVAWNGNYGLDKLADFNGDGKTDLLGYGNVATGRYAIAYGRASGLAAWQNTGVAWQPSNYSLDKTGDFNGDGKADILGYGNVVSSQYAIAYGGAAAGGLAAWTNTGIAWNGNYSLDKLADLNGDGKIDILCYGCAVGGSYSASYGTATGLAAWANLGAAWNGNYGLDKIGDFNGDGRADVLGYGNVVSSRYSLVFGAEDADLVVSLASGLGGSTTVTYAPSSRWSNTYLPIGMVFQTVSAVTVSDGRGDVQATNYVYQGARWRDATASDPTRELLGFRKATTTLASTGAYSETYYWQRAGTVAKPEVIYKRRASGAILSFDKYRFTENTTPPYTSLVTEAWGHECNGDGVVDASNNYVSGCRRVLTTYEWDTYANLVAEYQHGDYDVGGDERTAVRAFMANSSTYVVGLPAYDEMRAGIGKTGALLTRTRFFYDGAASEATAPTQGLLTRKGVWNDQTGNYVEHAFGYDSYGNETAVTDPLGRTSTRTYDSTYHMLVTATSNPLSQVMQSSWDPVLGVVLSETDADTNVKNHYYDPLGRATLSTAPDGAQVKFEYLDWGSATLQRIRQSRLLPGSTWVADEDWFDGLGRPYRKTSSNGVTEDTVYGASGKAWKKSLPYVAGDTVRYDVFTYDEIGRELTMTRPDGVVLRRSYDDGSVTVTPPAGAARTTYLDGYRRVVKAREIIGGVAKDTAFYYDLLGRLTRTVDALGNQTVATYDSLGRVLQRSDPDKGLWRYAYDDLGRITRETDALNQATTVGYDVLGRVTRRTYADRRWDKFLFDESGRGSSKGRLTTAITNCWSGDQVNCVLDLVDGVTTKAWYDGLGRRTRYEQQIGVNPAYAVSHAYDVAGRVSTVTYPDGEVVTYGYGTSGLSLGKLTSVVGSVAGTLVSGVTYTSKGQIAAITHGNGVTTSNGFDAYGERVASIQIGSLASISYAYDANGFVTSMTSPQLALTRWTYGYDSIGRLTSAVNAADGTKTATYGFDAGGRITARSDVGAYAYGDAAHAHAVTTAGSNTYSYDANGNLLAGGGRTFTYNLDHRPATIYWAGVTTSFTYDAMGLRVKKSSPLGTVVYVGSVYEDRGGAVTKYYFAGGARVARRDANGTSHLHADHLGSTRLVTNASGAEVKRYDYAPWGTVLAESGSRPESHRFTGQEADDETGLMYFQARYYDPALGRFTQADAFVPDATSPQALDPYAYANNSPSNYVDPSGHAPVVIAVAVWLGASAATVAAITAASALINICALVIGTALTFTNNPILQTIGMIMTGMAGAAIAGPLAGLSAAQSCVVAGAVALAQSPISPLDPTVKKVIGWGYTIWGGITSIENSAGEFAKAAGREGQMKAIDYFKAIGWTALKDAATVAIGWTLAYTLSQCGVVGRYALAIVGRFLLLGGSQLLSPGYGGALSMVGATYDLAYSLKYRDGRVYDLSGGAGGETFTLYAHTGYENPLAFGRQHIRVGDPQGGFWELGDFSIGHFGPGLGWAGWGSTQKIKVIMSPTQAAAFRAALEKGSQAGGAYMGFHADSYTYISAALQFATGKGAADLHINPGLIHW
jgi:RHS repeat-associated protein